MKRFLFVLKIVVGFLLLVVGLLLGIENASQMVSIDFIFHKIENISIFSVAIVSFILGGVFFMIVLLMLRRRGRDVGKYLGDRDDLKQK